ncbi:MAG: potassium channel family protein [Acidocella sp.]|nr:potassium channel family protein [Acidocella sp.]
MLALIILASSAYVMEGWSWGDAFYFVTFTVFTVGYGELHPILTPELRAITIATIVLGCTGVIFLTGVLVQFITYSQLQQLLGTRRMKTQIEKMSGHVVVCGYGRIGEALAEELKAGGIKFVILDTDETRLARAASHGYPTWTGDATDEQVLRAVGVSRARALVTAVPNDAINVFITLTARDLNKNLEIISRSISPRSKGKLLQAGANSVVAPTHIGAERIAQLILFPRTARLTEGTERLQAMAEGLRTLGLDIEVMAVPPDSTLAGATVEAIEHSQSGNVFVIAINRKNGETLTRLAPSTVVEAEDGVVLMTRTGRDTPVVS